MNKENLKKIFKITCIAMAVIAVIILVVGLLAIDWDEMPIVKIMTIIIAVLCGALAAEFGYMYHIENEVKPNYFLYDPETNKNMPLQKMTFDVINRRMGRYLSTYAQSEGRIWTDRVLDNPQLVMEDKFKPAVAYKLLFNLAEKDVDAGWRCFELASVETVEFLCAALDSNGDTEIARTLRHLKHSTPVNVKYVRDYLVSNKAYLRTKLCNYVYDNINRF